MGAGPAYSLYLTTYEFTKLKLMDYSLFKSSSFLTYVTAGLIAEAVSCCLFLPIDVIKERMQVASSILISILIGSAKFEGLPVQGVSECHLHNHIIRRSEGTI